MVTALTECHLKGKTILTYDCQYYHWKDTGSCGRTAQRDLAQAMLKQEVGGKAFCISECS